VLATAVLIAMSPWPAVAPEVEIVVVDVKAAAKGYRVSELIGENVVNEQREPIGTIDDFVVSREEAAVFAVLEVGEFLRLGGHLIAVPFRSLEMDGPGGRIVLRGATPHALRKLPVFEYGS
jgi:sporulation protein YlmC with PRC-barrel domain